MRPDPTQLDLGTPPRAIARRRYRAPELHRRPAPRGFVYAEPTRGSSRRDRAVRTALAMACGAALVVAGMLLRGAL